MCWNSSISLNTFIFACLALLFIFYANTYTKYKTHTFDNPLVYLFLFEVAAMQLVEFYLWRNLKNKSINKNLSIIASFIILFQQLTLILMIPNLSIRYSVGLLFLVFDIAHSVYKTTYNPTHFYTSIGKNGHLSWEWLNYEGYENIWLFGFLLFYILPLLFANNFLLTLFIISGLIVSLFFYFKQNTFGTMWCWIINIFLLYFVVDILLIQPYYEYNALC